MTTDELVTTAVNADDVPVTEVTAGERPQEEKKEPVVTNREALKQAIEKHRPEVEFKKSDKTELKDKEPSKSKIQASVDNEDPAPSEFSAAGRNAWQNKDIKGIQAEFRRLHDSRTQQIGKLTTERDRAIQEANKEKGEAKTWRELGQMASPYIEAQGLKGVTPQQAIMNALGLITAFQKADPATAKAELKALGIDLDKAPTGESSPTSIPKEYQEKIDSLQKWKTDTESKLRDQEFQGVVSNYEKAYKELDSLKTRTGEKVFPDLLGEAFCSTEEGKLFHAELGSITKDPIFIKGVFRRFPNADFTTVVREGYLALGRKVAGAPVTVSTNNQTDINKKIRASASSPGKPVPRTDASSLKGKLGTRAAMAKALEIHGWEN